jgi:hypothetical protein
MKTTKKIRGFLPHSAIAGLIAIMAMPKVFALSIIEALAKRRLHGDFFRCERRSWRGQAAISGMMRLSSPTS